MALSAYYATSFLGARALVEQYVANGLLTKLAFQPEAVVGSVHVFDRDSRARWTDRWVWDRVKRYSHQIKDDPDRPMTCDVYINKDLLKISMTIPLNGKKYGLVAYLPAGQKLNFGKIDEEIEREETQERNPTHVKHLLSTLLN